MHQLAKLFRDNEEWLMQRVLEYAKSRGYTRYTSTLQEAWRLSISGLTASIAGGLERFADVPELGPGDDAASDPLTEFGVAEAQKHRRRGVTLAMFLGLMKYYRQSYFDLMAAHPGAEPARERLFVERCFDRIEVAFCQEWTGVEGDERIVELQKTNRFMTNEKNMYLTVFESMSDPVIMLDAHDRLVNLNQAASLLTDPAHVPGGHYYKTDDEAPAYGKRAVDNACVGRLVSEVFPWLEPPLSQIAGGADNCECETTVSGKRRVFEVRRSARPAGCQNTMERRSPRL